MEFSSLGHVRDVKEIEAGMTDQDLTMWTATTCPRLLRFPAPRLGLLD